MKKEKRIVYEDFDENYVHTSEEEQDLLEDDDDGEGEGTGLPPGIIPINSEMFTGKIVNTPWGNFTKKNKFAPFNFYSLQIMYLQGMSTLTIPRFADLMDNIEGVALWRSLDPYTIIVGKAKLYEWPEVKENISAALLKSEVKTNDVDKTVQKIISENTGKQYFAIVFPNGKFIVTPADDPLYEKNIVDADNVKKTLRGVITIKNGEVQ